MTRRRFKTLLVAIETPLERQQPALRRAVGLAQRTGARLILFHSAFDPYVTTHSSFYSATPGDIDKFLAERRAALEKLATPLRRLGLKVSVKTEWDYPAHEAIVRETLRSKPDVVVAQSRQHSVGARVFFTNTDWQLIRLCPAPLLFVKQPRTYGKARVLAAIDPLHSADKPARLDRLILDAAGAMTAAYSGRLDVAHAWLSPSLTMVSTSAEPMAIHADPTLDAQHERYVKRAVQRCVAPLDLPQRQLHLELGLPEKVLPALARRLRADVLVMGAVSRRGLKRLFIGNTAERVIDAAPCDLLVVKPRGFKTPVNRRSTLSR